MAGPRQDDPHPPRLRPPQHRLVAPRAPPMDHPAGGPPPSPRPPAPARPAPSPFEPPGWITALQPASAATSSASGNGKKASEEHTAPLARSPALRAAIHDASTRDI